VRGGCAQELVGITLPKLKGPGTKPIAPPHGCDPKSSALRALLEAGLRKAAAVNEAHGDDASGARACAAHGHAHKASKAFMFFARPNVRAKLGPTVGRQARDADNARALQPGPGGLPLGLSLSDRLGLRAKWLRARIGGDNPAQVKRPRDYAHRFAAYV